MAKTFRSWDVEQSWLLPASVHDFVPSGHQAHFVRDTVREGRDLSATQMTENLRAISHCLFVSGSGSPHDINFVHE